MAKKNLKDIHPLIPILCEAVEKNNDCIIEHLNRTKINDHKYIDLVFGTHNIHELSAYLMKLTGKLDIEVLSNDSNVYECRALSV